MIAGTIVLLMFALLAMGMPVGFILIASGALGIFWIGGANTMLESFLRCRATRPRPMNFWPSRCSC